MTNENIVLKALAVSIAETGDEKTFLDIKNVVNNNFTDAIISMCHDKEMQCYKDYQTLDKKSKAEAIEKIRTAINSLRKPELLMLPSVENLKQVDDLMKWMV